MSAKTRAKAHLRSEIRQTLKNFSRKEVCDFSKNLRQKLVFSPRSRVALFAGTKTEPMLLDLIGQFPKVTWFLPKVIGPREMEFVQITHTKSLRKGAFGILEPGDGPVAESLDYIVCPGLAFTHSGKRLGQGGGFYDQALPRFPDAKVLGVAFTCQILDDLPSENHDRQMDLVITP